jgi:hypothetical protein
MILNSKQRINHAFKGVGMEFENTVEVRPALLVGQTIPTKL